MNIVRSSDRPVITRRAPLPTLQRLVDATVGARSVTVIVNRIEEGQQVPTHRHDVEEILLVTTGQCAVTVGADTAIAVAGDAVVIPPGVDHAICYYQEAADIIGVLAAAHAALNTPVE